jgi:hypothetical protein
MRALAVYWRRLGRQDLGGGLWVRRHGARYCHNMAVQHHPKPLFLWPLFALQWGYRRPRRLHIVAASAATGAAASNPLTLEPTQV